MSAAKKHRVYWDRDESRPNVLRIVLEHAASWDDFSQVVDDSAEMVKACEGRYDVIVEPRALMPPGDAIPQLQRGRKLLTENPKMGLLVIVVPTIAMLLVQTLQRMMDLMRISIAQTCFVNSVEAATRLIETNRENQQIPAQFKETARNFFVSPDVRDEDDAKNLPL